MKSLLKVAFVGIFVLAAVGWVAAQSTTPTVTPNNGQNFIHFNLGPCDFSNTFYQDNGLDLKDGSELNKEPDGRFGTFRQFGPPATGNQQNWVYDEDNCSERDPTRRDFRILATTGGNSDDANSPFTCSDQVNSGNGGPACVNQPANGGQIPETLEFISILAFLHNENTFIGAHGANTQNYTRNVGFINGGLEGVQQNPGENITITQGQDPQLNPEDTTVAGEPPVTAGLTPRGESMQFIVSNFEAYGAIDQFNNTLKCPAGATTASQCSPAPGNFAGAPCSLLMINNLQQPGITTLPTFCFNVADTKDSHGNTISDVATPKLRQNWRFATNRNAMDGSDNNGVTNGLTGVGQDSPYGYFCDDLLGMWIITYFWFTQPPNDPTCGVNYNAIGSGKEPNGSGGFIQVQGNGFAPDGFPVVLTANELNNWMEGTLAADGVTPCGAEGQEDPGGTDGGSAWLVCPAIPDPRNGAITSDAFLDVTTHHSLLDPFVSSNFNCLQQTGKFCFESAPSQ